MRAISLRTVVLAAGIPLASLAFVAALYFGWRSEPAFYGAALAVDRDGQIRGSNELLEQASALVNDVRKQGSWQALFTVEQINGWLAIDLPKNHGDLLPPELDRPRVLLNRGRIVVACRRGAGAMGTVVTLSVEPYLAKPNELSIRICSARAGWFPLPLQPILDQLSQGAADAELPLRWEQADGDPIAVIGIIPRRNDGQVMWVESLEIHSGELFLAGSTRSGSWPAEEQSPEETPQAPVLQAKLPRNYSSGDR